MMQGINLINLGNVALHQRDTWRRGLLRTGARDQPGDRTHNRCGRYVAQPGPYRAGSGRTTRQRGRFTSSARGPAGDWRQEGIAAPSKNWETCLVGRAIWRGHVGIWVHACISAKSGLERHALDALDACAQVLAATSRERLGAVGRESPDAAEAAAAWAAPRQCVSGSGPMPCASAWHAPATG
jgi:hypothetical protein